MNGGICVVSGGHTPGPWEIDADLDVVATNGEDIATCYGFDHDQIKANARLCAAAPDLLAALEALVRCFDIKDGISIRDEQALKYAAHVSALARGERSGA
jgi:hypothetical protein